jgi:hypothetical protein
MFGGIHTRRLTELYLNRQITNSSDDAGDLAVIGNQLTDRNAVEKAKTCSIDV